MYMNGDIASFRELLAGYKSTITIALADANLLVACPNRRRLSNLLIGVPPRLLLKF
jgi:hypothetical protein